MPSMLGRVAAVVVLLTTLSAGVRPGRSQPPAQSHRTRPPNVVLILADDMGYSDLGCYGGEVHTPNLDRLASGGLRYTQFYNTARCWPTRAAILTGYYAQQVHRDTIPGTPGTGPGGLRPKWARLLPDYLRPLGYRSYHSGKWHMDSKPIEAGFDRSYWLEDTDRYFSPKFHFEDDKPLAAVQPGSGYYATSRIAEHAIECMKQHGAHHADQPFFSYIAFTSPHFPLQARARDVERYRNRFREGWDKMRAERLERMRRLGIVRCELSARTPGVPAWDSLSDEQKEMWSSRMATHAAMVHRMDREIGRVVKQLREMGVLDNTVIFFLSDNGASAEKVLRGDGDDPSAAPGSPQSYRCLEAGWANLANTPLRLSKIFVHEGGISTSLIVHWPHGIAARGALRETPGHVIDLLPTIMEIAGGKKPDTLDGRPVPPAPGRSLVPSFATDGGVIRRYLWWYHSNNRAIRVGDWKLVSQGPLGPWELYDLRQDRGESHNLAAEKPDLVRTLGREWGAHMAEFRRTVECDTGVPVRK